MKRKKVQTTQGQEIIEGVMANVSMFASFWGMKPGCNSSTMKKRSTLWKTSCGCIYYIPYMEERG